MKKTILSTLFIIFLINPQLLFSQGERELEYKPGTFVHWFYVKAFITIDKEETHKEVYSVRRLGDAIISGKIEKYQEKLWLYLSRGSQLAIGPFAEYEDAKRALTMYNLSGKTRAQMQKEIDKFAAADSMANETCFFYPIVFYKTKRTKRYVFDHDAARVSERTYKEFKDFLWDSLFAKKLTIGPFASRHEAEKSKNYYRLEEGGSSRRNKRRINKINNQGE